MWDTSTAHEASPHLNQDDVDAGNEPPQDMKLPLGNRETPKSHLTSTRPLARTRATSLTAIDTNLVTLSRQKCVLMSSVCTPLASPCSAMTSCCSACCTHARSLVDACYLSDCEQLSNNGPLSLRPELNPISFVTAVMRMFDNMTCDGLTSSSKI